MTIYYFISTNQQNESSHRIHQLSNSLVSLHKQSFIIYVPFSNTNIFPQYPHIHISSLSHIIDIPTNVVIMTEIYTEERFRSECGLRNCKVVIWWHTYLNASVNYTLSNLSNPNILNVFHSYYEYVMVYPHLSNQQSYCFVNDYITTEHTESYVLKNDKENAICFDGGSDLITKKICQENNIVYYDLNTLTTTEQIEILKKCKVYVDMSSHSGQRILPRVASLLSCVVITNKSGSAGYWEDVPIYEKIGIMNSNTIVTEIHKVFENYSHYLSQQDFYRQTIMNERNEFEKNVKEFIQYIETPSHRSLVFVDEHTFLDKMNTNKDLFQRTSFHTPEFKNLYSLATNVSNILQIGFGDGDSITVFLLANNNNKVLCIDENENDLSRFKYLQSQFGDRIELLIGNIPLAISKFKELSDRKFEVVHLLSSKHFEMCKEMTTDYLIINDDEIKMKDVNWNELKMYESSQQIIFRKSF